MKFKSTLIVLIIVLSLIPVYLLHKYLQKAMRPKESMKRLLLWMLTMFFIIFAYTFMVVFIIKLLFPGA